MYSQATQTCYNNSTETCLALNLGQKVSQVGIFIFL